MTQDRLITLAIHSYERAVALKTILENEGIKVVLQNVNLLYPATSPGVRIRISEADLARALRVVEGADCPQGAPAAAEVADGNAAGAVKPVVLVPVDFSECSQRACRIAFRFALSYGAEVCVLHSFISPSLGAGMEIGTGADYDMETLADEEAAMSVEEAARSQLDTFARRLRGKIREGALPPVPFTTLLVDDVPEDAIRDTARQIEPRLVVMGTRGADRRDHDMIGSVTAEVLDTCRYPVFTIPEAAEPAAEPPIDSHVVFFCNYEQPDLLALDLFYRLFPKARFQVTLINVPAKKMPTDIDRLSRGLQDYCRSHLSRFTFAVKTVEVSDMETEMERIGSNRAIDFIAVPNKKRNVFSRLFNPGLAHRLLFHADIPLLVLPV